jgi:hypothetical protein
MPGRRNEAVTRRDTPAGPPDDVGEGFDGNPCIVRGVRCIGKGPHPWPRRAIRSDRHMGGARARTRACTAEDGPADRSLHDVAGADESAPVRSPVGVVSEPWCAPHLGLDAVATRYVASIAGLDPSGTLHVVQSVLIASEGWEAHASIDPGSLLGLAPTATAFKLDKGKRTMNWEIIAPVDPSFELRVLLPLAEGADRLQGYLDDYLPIAAELFAQEDAADLVRSFMDEYWDYLENVPDMHSPPPSRFDLAEGQKVALGVTPHPKRSGRTMLILAALDLETGERISVSNLVGLGVRGDNEITADF